MSKKHHSDWKSDLESIRKELTKATSAQQPGSVNPPSSGSAETMPNFSTEVNSIKRAGRAPYNFVPAPDKLRLDADEPPSADRYHMGLLSGEIDLEIVALTDFYIRGMWSFQEYQKLTTEAGNPVEVKDQIQPFGIGSCLRLPGSSLRGMLRTLVEILSDAPLEPINDSQLFFRAVGASDDPNDKSFEPHAKVYKERMVKGSGGSADDPIGPSAEVGYLHASKDGWKIRRALSHSENGTQWYRVRTNNDEWHEGMYKIWFIPQRPRTGTYPHRRQVHYKFGTVVNFRVRNGTSPGEGYEPGWLICSGKIPRKYLQWIVHEEDRSAEYIKIPEYDVAAYKESGISYWLKEKPQLVYREGEPAKPCFYVEWHDAEGKHHVSFGHTPYFRLPYKTTPQKANPAKRPEGDTGWSLAEAIFGRVRPGKAAKTRVFVEDGMLIGDPSSLTSDNPITTVLGAPKPTTYQHYLVQEDESKAGSIHWDDKRARLRGHKLYWHRPGAKIKEAGANQQKVATKFLPAKAGAKFHARIRYENLRPHELGALLTALELPQGCAHKLGMAKPLGLGSFRISIKEMREINRPKRYAAFYDKSKECLITGATSVTDKDRERFKDLFAAWKTRDGSASAWQRLWEDPRMAELKALLTYDELPANRARWHAMTRYLRFGDIQGYGPKFQYNEYKHVDHVIGPWPPPIVQGNRRRFQLEPRRPLPPASQVLREACKDGPGLPADEEPRFSDNEKRPGARKA
jgi:CRISPR-associated protein (TIGR03986 family)